MAEPPTLEQLATTDIVPISSLNSSVSPSPSSSIKAVVSLIWPYSASTRSAALLLAESDFRLRYHRGQVRIQLQGATAQALAKVHVEIGDIIHLNLEGARWVEDVATVQTPGRSVEGELLFTSQIAFQLKRQDVTISSVNIQGQDSPIRLSSPMRAATPTEHHETSLHTPLQTGHSKLWNTPTPFRNSFGSSNDFSPDQYDLFGDTEAWSDRPAKRMKFGGASSKWKYVTRRSASPEETEPAALTDVSSPTIMGPPKLPRLQTEITQSSASANSSKLTDKQSPPQSPKLHPIQSATLPIVSPLPSSPLFQPVHSPVERSSPLVEATNRRTERKTENTPTELSSSPLREIQELPSPLVPASSNENHVSHEQIPSDQFQATQSAVDENRAFFTTANQLPAIEGNEAAVIDLLSPDEERRLSTSEKANFPIDFNSNEAQSIFDEIAEFQNVPHIPHLENTFGDNSATLIQQVHGQDTNRYDAPTTQSSYDLTSIPPPPTGRAVVHESGQFTPEESQEVTRVLDRVLEAPSSGHRVDEILDGNLPPTPQRSEIPQEMVSLSTDPNLGSPLDADVQMIRQPHARDKTQQIPPPLQTQGPVTSEPKLSSDQKPPLASTMAAHDGLRTAISYYSSLSSLDRHINTVSESGENSVDVIAVVSSPTSEPRKAKSGPKDFFTTLHVADSSIFPGTLQVQVFRPYKISLPIADIGDVILLRSFSVKRRQGENYLLSGASSAWYVWRYSLKQETLEHDVPLWAQNAFDSRSLPSEERKGPPVEVGAAERQSVQELRAWWHSLQDATTTSRSMNVASFDTLSGDKQTSKDRHVLVAS